jgi:hypothetical protein
VDKKIEITKTSINTPSRKIKANWELTALEHGWKPPKKVSEMTEEEKQDEVIRRLKEGIKRPELDPADEISNELSRQISLEIDKEILKSLMEAFHGTRKA